MPEMPTVNDTYNTSQGKDVKNTQMLKGTAQDSLYGKNVTKQDTRSGSPSGPFGGGGKSSGKAGGMC